MVRIHCSELTKDEQLALASAISDDLEGLGVALIKGDEIVVDQLTARKVEVGSIMPIVSGFVSKRTESLLYSLDVSGDVIRLHSPDPIGARRRRNRSRLPPNAFQCPACGLILPSQEKYDDHMRIHDILRGLR
jgi:hypothetical protein